MLGELRPAGEAVGELGLKAASELGLSKGVVVVVGGHDQPCNALGAGQINEKTAIVTTGTVECLTMAFNKPWSSDDILQTKFPCYCHINEDMYVLLAYNNTGGNLLKWYSDKLGYEETLRAREQNADPYDVIIDQISNEPSNVFVLAHFAGGSPPELDPDSQGAILGLSLTSGRQDIVKGIMEGLTFELRRYVELLEQRGVKIDKLRALGGGARSRNWLQLKADITGKSIATINVTEAGCLGAAILAGVGARVYKSREEAVNRLVREQEVVEPDQKKHEQYQDRYELYNRIYPAIAEINHTISHYRKE